MRREQNYCSRLRGDMTPQLSVSVRFTDTRLPQRPYKIDVRDTSFGTTYSEIFLYPPLWGDFTPLLLMVKASPNWHTIRAAQQVKK